MWVETLIDAYQRQKRELDWLDAHCWLDLSARDRFRTFESLADFRHGLARYGVRQAIVASPWARESDPAEGNRRIVEAVREVEGFWGAAVVPLDSAAEADCRRQVETWIAQKVRLVRLFPRLHNYVLSDWCAGCWLSLFEEFRLPIAVWHTQIEWDELADACRRHPQLPVVLEAPNRKLLYHNRVYCRLLESLANFHVEIHNLVGYLGLDDAARRFGSSRLLFGTYFPYQDPNTSMMLVTHGELSDAERRNIAGDNMRRLMQAVKGAPT